MSGLIEVGVVTTLEELVAEESWKGDSPGSPVVKTPLSQCRGTGFDPWEGNQSSAGKESACNACRRPRFDSWVGKIPWRRARLPTPVFLGFPGGSDSKSACTNGTRLVSFLCWSLFLLLPLTVGFFGLLFFCL